MDVKLSDPPDIGTPDTLFESKLARGDNGIYVAFADSHRFLSIEAGSEPPTLKINVALNWAAELKL